MMRFARIVGLLSMISGAFLLFSPDSTRELLGFRIRALRHLADWNADFAQLSSGPMRMLGSWFLLTGTLLVSTTSRPAAKASIGEVGRHEFHDVA